MAFDIKYKQIQTCRMICDVSVEQSVEGECSVPDYQPEVQRIIKCFTSPVVTRKVAAGNKATVEGYVTANVVYSSTDGALCGVSARVPFSRQADLREAVADGCDISVRLREQYFNCRAVNGRKLDFRGAYMVDIKAMGQFEDSVVHALDGAGLQSLVGTTEYLHADSFVNRQFTLEEVFTADYEIGEVILCEGKASIDRHMVSDGELSVNGAVTVVVKAFSAGAVKTKEYRLPFNQLLDLPASTLDGEAMCEIRTVSCSMQKVYEEENTVRIVASVAVDAAVFEKRGAEYLIDAFSTEHPCTATAEELTVVGRAGRVFADYSVSESFDTFAGRQLADYRLSNFVFTPADGAISAQAQLWCVFVDTAGEYSAESFPFGFSVELDGNPGEEQLWELDNETVSLTVGEGGDMVSMKLAGRVCGNIVSYECFDAVTAVTLDEGTKKPKRDAGLCIYYADEDESVWSIAKKYDVSTRAITGHNDLSSQSVGARTMLLIPITN